MRITALKEIQVFGYSCAQSSGGIVFVQDIMGVTCIFCGFLPFHEKAILETTELVIQVQSSRLSIDVQNAGIRDARRGFSNSLVPRASRVTA